MVLNSCNKQNGDTPQEESARQKSDRRAAWQQAIELVNKKRKAKSESE